MGTWASWERGRPARKRTATEGEGGRGRAASIIRTPEARKEVPRVGLPFQIIETVNESRVTREAKRDGGQTSRFGFYEGSEGHRRGFAG